MIYTKGEDIRTDFKRISGDKSAKLAPLSETYDAKREIVWRLLFIPDEAAYHLPPLNQQPLTTKNNNKTLQNQNMQCVSAMHVLRFLFCSLLSRKRGNVTYQRIIHLCIPINVRWCVDDLELNASNEKYKAPHWRRQMSSSAHSYDDVFQNNNNNKPPLCVIEKRQRFWLDLELGGLFV